MQRATYSGMYHTIVRVHQQLHILSTLDLSLAAVRVR